MRTAGQLQPKQGCGSLAAPRQPGPVNSPRPCQPGARARCLLVDGTGTRGAMHTCIRVPVGRDGYPFNQMLPKGQIAVSLTFILAPRCCCQHPRVMYAARSSLWRMEANHDRSAFHGETFSLPSSHREKTPSHDEKPPRRPSFDFPWPSANARRPPDGVFACYDDCGDSAPLSVATFVGVVADPAANPACLPNPAPLAPACGR